MSARREQADFDPARATPTLLYWRRLNAPDSPGWTIKADPRFDRRASARSRVRLRPVHLVWGNLSTSERGISGHLRAVAR